MLFPITELKEMDIILDGKGFFKQSLQNSSENIYFDVIRSFSIEKHISVKFRSLVNETVQFAFDQIFHVIFLLASQVIHFCFH